MNTKNENITALNDIKTMMERSSRFISLSGLSGVAAGICALAGSLAAYLILNNFVGSHLQRPYPIADVQQLRNTLLLVSIAVFVSAFLSAFVFTYLRSKKTGVPVWGSAAKRMVINVAVPFIAGGILIFRLMTLGHFGLLAPSCLIIYGISLFCGSGQSTNEIRYLAILQIILGCIALWFLGNGLLFWTIGFGLLHIIYGLVMWFKYERK